MIMMILLPLGSTPSVLKVGPGERITYGTGIVSATMNNTTNRTPPTISVRTRRLSAANAEPPGKLSRDGRRTGTRAGYGAALSAARAAQDLRVRPGRGPRRAP